eukprot:CAMPEP_0206514230 /NCGR_PEP_ID=MMETSP0324_2-20121206/61995_1 /ASSEMBLY_ACC=CAM_ASM_000836 /TAXON_ID=2866 /ORGANISM="Crypthecodinium cohnii, Strain Seligo" /LENGTH=229 /DNA_ID=CAMNT_0054006627 /DNA_START=87 /DNA_END=776 /DNA_ORIENTATION=-
MPQVVARREPGIALDLGLTKQPAPVFCDFKRYPSRDYRTGIHDHNNAILGQPVIDNALEDRHWQGNGFPGNIQFVPYLGRELLRPGVKFERDIQGPTVPKDNFKALNVTQMGRSKDAILASASHPTLDHHRVHQEAMSTLRAQRSIARSDERTDNAHAFRRDEVEHSTLRQERLAEQAKHLQGLRCAGLASINPRLGTCGSLPDMRSLRGPEGNDAWRSCTPWALDGNV